MSLLKAMATVAGMTALSRVAGFARDMMTAAYLGAGPIGDAFFVALKLPNFFRRVTAEGAFSVAFVPIYTQKIASDDPASGDEMASNAFMVMMTFLSIITLPALLFMPYVLMVVAPGFADDPVRADYAVEFSRITFPYLLLMSLAALLGGVLNANDRFAPFAFAPVLFNLTLIGALLLSSYFDTVGHALSWGLLISGFFQLFFLWGCAARSGIKIKIRRPVMDADVKHILKLMGPAMIGAGVMQINLFADMTIASFLETGSISYLYYADRLNQLPLGTVGIAVGTALLPMLSRSFAKGDRDEAIDLFSRAMEYCLLLALPAAVALAVIPHTLIMVLFQRGAFTAQDSAITATILSCYAIGLPAYIATKVFSTAHWARHDTTTPVRIAIITTLLNIVLCLIFVQFMGVAGIALGTGLVAWVQFALHIRSLKNHPMAQFDQKFLRNMPKIILASCVMGAGIYSLSVFLWTYMVDAHTWVRVMYLGSIVVCGAGIYGFLVIFSGAVTLKDMKRFVRRKKV